MAHLRALRNPFLERDPLSLNMVWNGGLFLKRVLGGRLDRIKETTARPSGENSDAPQLRYGQSEPRGPEVLHEDAVAWQLCCCFFLLPVVSTKKMGSEKEPFEL